MLPYGRVQAPQKRRSARLVSKQVRATRREVRKDRTAGLAELINSLAQGLVSIGIPGGPGNRRPPAVAY